MQVSQSWNSFLWKHSLYGSPLPLSLREATKLWTIFRLSYGLFSRLSYGLFSGALCYGLSGWRGVLRISLMTSRFGTLESSKSGKHSWTPSRPPRSTPPHLFTVTLNIHPFTQIDLTDNGCLPLSFVLGLS